MRALLPFTLLALAVAPTLATAAEYQIASRDEAGLIRAIRAANASPEADIIHLAADGIYTLDLTDSNGLGLPPISGRLQIQGHGAEIRRYGDKPMQLLEIAPEAVVQISDLGMAEANRGALVNHGHLTLDRVTITDSDNDPAAAHAIVLNHGRMLMRDSLLGYNRVRGVAENGSIVVNSGVLELFGTRFIANEVVRSSGDALAAGAVLNQGTLAVENSLFEDNTVDSPNGDRVASAVLDLSKDLPTLP